MPAPPKTPSLFLGIELATDQLRASLLDESLELVGVESVDFDSEMPEYQTQGGIFTTPGEAYTTPVEMWIKGLDLLFEKLSRNYDLSRIKSIGGSAQHAIVYLKSPLPNLTPPPTTQLYTHLRDTLALPHTPTSQDTSAHTHALAIEALLGGPDHMASRVGMCANPSMLSAQLLKLRESTKEAWGRIGRVSLASGFLCSVICARWVGMGEGEAVETGMWNHAPGGGAGAAQGTSQGWDEGVLDIVGGSREEGRRVRTWLGDVDCSGARGRVGNVSRYLVERYGFDPETIVAPFISSTLSNYLSLLPSQGDAILSFGPMDTLLTPAAHYIPTRLYTLIPHPVQDGAGDRAGRGGKRYIAMLSSRNADVPRALVRDMYTKSWSAFDRLVDVVPPGGSIGLDDKLFSFWYLQGDTYPYNRVKGIFRFETGVKVNEFRDLRANPRCLIESQVLAFRVKWSRMISTGVLGTRKPSGGIGTSTPPPITSPLSTTPPSISALPPKAKVVGMSFDPYDPTPLPSRILATGAAANFPSVASLLGDIFNSPVFVPSTQVDSAQVVPHRNAPARGFPSRASIGSAYLARWVWSREWGAGGLGVFEDEMKRLLGKRWVGSGGVSLRTNINTPLPGGSLPGGKGSGSGASTPFGRERRLGSVFNVEEEEEEEEVLRIGGVAFLEGLERGPGVIGAPFNAYQEVGYNPNIPIQDPQTPTPASVAAGQTAPTPLTPVVAMPTSDAEKQIGLGKVAEPDMDSFLCYASVVPEFCRLEGLLIKGII
ncbi:actin-like ATPase domain-containing protein [Cyathus striatus]|nr:actin-like ATPase domain-containing protein [Cyathus striatus]